MATRKPPRTSITLSETDGVRYLHFGTEWIQGGMRIARPFSLELEYQRQMMALALLLPEPRRVIQLGLGAAALTKFCWRNLPDAEIVAVEISELVVANARQWFRLPPDDDRLRVELADAREFIGDRRRSGKTDWLQVDLYDAAARGPVYDDVEFYTLCRRALASPGVASFNLFGRSFDASFAAISEAFNGRVLALPEVAEGNRIVLAVAGPKLELEFTELYERAQAIEAVWRLPARRWLAGLRAENELVGELRL
ncbi:MAG: spermidine synthase [Burkholderiaceae bacterium]